MRAENAMTQRFDGEFIDDAVCNAAVALGVEPHQLTYRVLITARLQGGKHRVIIEAEVKRRQRTRIPAGATDGRLGSAM